MRLNIDYEKNFLDIVKNKNLVLFGAGGFGGKFCEFFRSKDIGVTYFCDNDENKWGTVLHGVKVISTDELYSMDKETNILITSYYHNQIFRQLSQQGFKNLFFFTYFYFMDLFLESSCGNIYAANEAEINECFNILYDHKSRVVFQALIDYRITWDNRCLDGAMDRDYEFMYFPEDIIKLTEEESYVDCGAYDGDTIKSFINKCEGKFNNIYGFEPDKKNFQLLKGNLSKYDRAVKLFNMGTYSENKRIAFAKDKGHGSYISEEGDDFIEVTSLDYALQQEKVTFIKMDVEGAEKESIIGGRNLIIKNEPILAISLYHKSEDLWEIPILIKKLVPNYNIYLRHFRNDLLETVCFAVPKHRTLS